MEASLTVALGGEYGKLFMEGAKRSGGGLRGSIQGFSRASRRRLLDTVNQVDRRCIGSMLFVTLTYPGQWPGSWRVWKGHLRAMVMRLDRRYPGIQLVWRLEFQERGAPHFHLLVFNVERIDIDWLSRAWFEVVGSGDLRHLAAGTQVQRVQSWRGVLYYVGKYMAKTAAVSFATGRVWGVIGGLPVVLVVIPVSLCQFYRLRRVLRGWLERRLKRRVWWSRGRGVGIKVYLGDGVMVGLLSL